MSDEATTSAEVPEEGCEGGTCPTNPASGTKSHAATLHEDVAKALKTDGAKTVRERVVNTLVEEKLEERKKQVLDGLGKLKQQRQEIQTMVRKGEAPASFTLDKKPLGSVGYTKAEAEAIQKAKEKADKLERALDKALADGDYSKLAECCK